MWLSMDVAGTAVSNTPAYDGELLPMRRLASSVYALQAENANKLGGLTASQFLQTVPGSSSVNVIAPTAASTVALRVKGTTGTSANVLEVFDSTATPTRQAFFDATGALNVAKTIQPTVTNTADIGLTGTQFRTGYFGTSVITPTVDTNSAVALSIGATTASAINIGKTGSNIATTINGTTLLKPVTDSATALQVQNAAGAADLTVNTTTGMLTVNQGGLTVAGLSNPATPTLASAATGGTLAAATYTYRLSATSGAGETQAIASNPVNVTTTGTTSANTVSWTAVTNATGYKLYRSTDGGTTWYVNTLGAVTTAADNGSNFAWGTAGTPSLFINATGNVSLTTGASLYLDSAHDGQLTSSTDTTILGNYYGAGGNVSIQADSFLVEDTTGYNVNLRINNTGAATFENRTNSTNAFKIQNAAAGSIFDADTTNSRVGIGTAAPSETLTVNGNFNVRDADTVTKQYRFRTSGSNLDLEGGGASIYGSVWSAANFTGTQHNKFVLENGSDVTQAIKTWQFRDSPFGTLRHTVDGTVGNNTTFNQDSEATNFIVQGQTDANLVFVQGSTNRVGIGNNAPGYKLDVTGTANASTSVLTPLLDTASAVALSIGTTNATAINLGKTASNIATTINGTAVIKPTTGNDSTAAFQIQNASSVAFFTVDTTNERVYVGPTAGDTVGAILVLGNKTTAGDPTGVNGATYYNASSATFRCYENGAWTDCLTHHIVVTTADQTAGNGSCTIQDLSGLTFAVNANRLYKFHASIEYDASATSVGIKLAGAFTGTLTRLSYVSYGLTGATSAWFGGGSGVDQGSCGAGSANTTGNTAVTEGSIQTATSGTFRMRFASSSGSGITIKAGSTIEWW
ncbi:MAG: hypothetical protein NVS3B29_02930 [Candidatus Saccharimonadales bacterium]